MPAMMSAKSAPGNVYAEGNIIDGTHHTLSAWDDRESMLRFMRGTNHVAAMGALDSIATGKVYGYESDAIPSWSEAREMYDLHGRVVGAAGREIRKKEAEAKREAEVANTGEQDEEEEGEGKEAGGSDVCESK